MIRVLHVINQFAAAGTELTVLRVAQHLNAGFEHVICSIRNPLTKMSCAPAQLVCLEDNAHRSRSTALPLYNLIKTLRPDVVHSRNWGGIEAVVAARVAGVQNVIHSEHGRNVDTIHGLPWRQRFMRRACYRWAHQVFAVTNELKQYYVTHLGTVAHRMLVIENGIDIERFRPDPTTRALIRNRLGLPVETTVVGCVGRFDPIKDQCTLVKACRILRNKGCDIHMVLVGDGPERQCVERLVADMPEMSAHVTFTGLAANVDEWLRVFDIFVLPSLSEGMSNTLLEAMSSAVAPVVTHVGSNPEVVEDGISGQLFAPGAVGQLASIIENLCSDRTRRADMGLRARARVQERFGISRMLDDYQRLYSRAVKNDRIGDSVLARAHNSGIN